MNFYNIYLFPNFKNIIQKPVLFLSSNGLWIIEIEGCGCERRSAYLVNILQKGSFFIAKKTIFWVQTRKVPNDSEMRESSHACLIKHSKAGTETKAQGQHTNTRAQHKTTRAEVHSQYPLYPRLTYSFQTGLPSPPREALWRGLSTPLLPSFPNPF